MRRPNKCEKAVRLLLVVLFVIAALFLTTFTTRNNTNVVLADATVVPTIYPPRPEPTPFWHTAEPNTRHTPEPDTTTVPVEASVAVWREVSLDAMIPEDEPLTVVPAEELVEDESEYEGVWMGEYFGYCMEPIEFDYEYDLLKRVVIAEAGGESNRGIKAVVQVIYDRVVYGPELYGETIEDVLTAPGAFTAPYRGDVSAWGNRIDEAIYDVFVDGNRVWDKHVFYFYNPLYSDAEGKRFMESQQYIEQIGNHIFVTRWTE